MVNNSSLVFPPMKGNFPCFPLVHPKEDLLLISFQCLQTNISQIAGFLTCSLSTFFNTRRKYWTITEKDLRNTQTFHLTSREYKDRTFPIKKLRSWSIPYRKTLIKLTHAIANNKYRTYSAISRAISTQILTKSGTI